MVESLILFGKKAITTFIVFLSVYLMPLQTAGLSILALMFIDLITGLWASMSSSVKITSNRLKRTITKFIVYGFALITGLIFTSAFGVNVLVVIAFYLASVEIKSIAENLHIVYPHINLYGVIKEALMSEKSKILQERKKEKENLKDNDHHKLQ